MMKYKQVVLTKKGDPEVLKIQDKTLKNPKKKEVQIEVLACGVGRTDVAMRKGYYPYAPKVPFVPGYEIVGTITAMGSDVTRFNIGDTVASLTVYGGYSEFILLDESDLVKVPEKLDPDKAVALILNYCTAYQILHRTLTVKKGDTVLITGASGGVGTALMDLGKLAGLKMFGLASVHKHSLLIENGVTPIDYQDKKWVDQLNDVAPKGVDYVIDGIGGNYITKGFSALKKGGKLVAFGYPNFKGLISGLLKIKVLNLLPNGKTGEFYGISANYKKDKTSILKDIATLLDLLEQNKIKPIISHRFPLLKAKLANQMLEEGKAVGKIILLRKDLIKE